MVSEAKHFSSEKRARMACKELKTSELLTMLKAYLDPARKDSEMVSTILRTLEGRIREEDSEDEFENVFK